MSIKRKLKENRKIYAMYMALHSFNNKELCDRIWAINNDPFENKIIEYGSLNDHAIVYDLYLKHDSLGFFGLIRWLCAGLIYADRFGYKVCMHVDKNCLYYDPEFKTTDNVLEYYFDLEDLVSVSEVNESKNVIQFESKHIGICDLYYEDRDSVRSYAEEWKKYFKLNKKISQKINEDIYSLLAGEKCVGVHYRGTDYKSGYKNHPIAVNIEETIAAIKNIPNLSEYKKIFVASDEEGAINRLKKEFGDMVVTYSDTLRSVDGAALHTSKNVRKYHHYLLGFEVLRDVLTLASCDVLIAGHSNVSAFADVIKMANEQKYDYFYIINKGKNQKGKVYKKPKSV